MIAIPCNEVTHVWFGGKCGKCGAKMPHTGMTTPHGTPMHPRGARFWTFIQKERGIGLTSFSTDDCVAREFERLKAAYAEAEKRWRAAAKASPNSIEAEKARQLVADCAALMRHVPQHRTDNNRDVKAKAAAHEAAGVTARDLEFD